MREAEEVVREVLGECTTDDTEEWCRTHATSVVMYAPHCPTFGGAVEAIRARDVEVFREAQLIVKARSEHMARYNVSSPYLQALSDAWGLLANRIREIERKIL